MYKILKGMKSVTDIPITAKYRMGIKDNYPVADRIVPRLDEMGIALSTVSRNIWYLYLHHEIYILSIDSWSFSYTKIY